MFGGWFNFPDFYFFIVYNGAEATIYNSMDYHSAEMDKAIDDRPLHDRSEGLRRERRQVHSTVVRRRARHPAVPAVSQPGDATQCDRLSLSVPPPARLSAFREDLISSAEIDRASCDLASISTDLPRCPRCCEAARAAEKRRRVSALVRPAHGLSRRFLSARRPRRAPRKGPSSCRPPSAPILAAACRPPCRSHRWTNLRPDRAMLAVAVGNMLNLAESGFEPVKTDPGHAGIRADFARLACRRSRAP